MPAVVATVVHCRWLRRATHSIVSDLPSRSNILRSAPALQGHRRCDGRTDRWAMLEFPALQINGGCDDHAEYWRSASPSRWNQSRPTRIETSAASRTNPGACRPSIYAAGCRSTKTARRGSPRNRDRTRQASLKVPRSSPPSRTPARPRRARRDRLHPRQKFVTRFRQYYRAGGPRQQPRRAIPRDRRRSARPATGEGAFRAAAEKLQAAPRRCRA